MLKALIRDQNSIKIQANYAMKLLKLLTDVYYIFVDVVFLPGYNLPSTSDFAAWKPFLIDSLKLLCSLAQESVNNSINEFGAFTFLSKQLKSPVQFMIEINETLNQFQKRIPAEFAQTLDLVRTTAQGNALLAMFSSNWDLFVAKKGQGRNASFLSTPVIHNNTEQNKSCSCGTSRTCTIPLKIVGDYYTAIVDGMVFGCYLLETVLLSSLACFYSETCITDIRQALDALPLTPEDFIKLNNSATRFSINDTIEKIAYELFIESWTSNVSYERFFNSCSPKYCIYTYHYRFDALELLTTFLSVFAGLSLGVRFVVPHLIRLFKDIQRRFRITPLQPF